MNLSEFRSSVIMQRQRIRLNVGWELVRYHLEGMYGSVKAGVDKAGVKTFRVMDAVDVKHASQHEMQLEWSGSTTNDMIADMLTKALARQKFEYFRFMLGVQ